jgi:hypothetical protein
VIDNLNNDNNLDYKIDPKDLVKEIIEDFLIIPDKI